MLEQEVGLKKCWLETIKGNSFLVAIDFENKIFSLPAQNVVPTIVGRIKRLKHSIMTNKDMVLGGDIGWHVGCLMDSPIVQCHSYIVNTLYHT